LAKHAITPTNGDKVKQKHVPSNQPLSLRNSAVGGFVSLTRCTVQISQIL